ncbi:NADPH-dependent oxidoreductase [Oscillochloris sp. ZM17-4]|uniref:NADPH-dependent oxidoreductase n=1 Tax=Oscillochloris sp. ZM17-4 TaxID=2866714 RepID=UPI001C73D0EF|nr:NADPH-dependent oxidoreductase [Oscillochloris sp. ZM17-4]MBX0328146.1 NADPH-dependent oxidoreductase [Oscillochloris sp. ZM17-4]
MTTTEPATTAAELLRARYGADRLPAGESWSAAISAILQHRSIRSYQGTPLPEGALELLVAAAQSASTSSNLQAWSVVAVETPARRGRLAQLAGDQAHIRQAPLFLVWLADLSRLARAAEARGMPHAALDYTEMFLLAAVDAALAAQNAAVAAESLGMGVVYIGGMRNRPEDVAAELGLPPGAFAVFGMCVGYPVEDSAAAIKPRLPQAAVLHRERYDTAAEPAALEEYGRAMDAFYAEQQMRVRGDWVEHSARRVAGPETLSGRDTLRASLGRLGFPLK